MKWICPIEKRYHNQLKRCQNERYIADIQGVGLKISKLNRLDFMASIF